VALETSYDVNYASPVISDQPSTVTLASGLTLDAGFIVDLPSDDSTITINSPIDSPSRAGATVAGTADEGVVDLRATNVVINAPVTANNGARFLTSRFHREPTVTTELSSAAFTQDTISVNSAVGIEVGAIAIIGNDSGLSFIPNDTNVVAVDSINNTVTLSHPVSIDAGVTAEFYNPSSVLPAALVPPVPSTLVTVDSVVNKSTIFLDPSTLVGPDTALNLQPGAIIQSQGVPNTPLNIPLNTFVAAVNTTTGRVDFTRPISVQNTDGLTFFNPPNLNTTVEQFRATAPIQAESFNFDIREDVSTSVNSRGSLYVAGSSGLLGTTGGSANTLTVSTGMADIVFEGNVDATTQSYFFQTTVAETPYSFTTKNSSGVPTGSISATTADITLANLSPASEENSVVQIVDLDTAVDSLRLSAAFDEQLNPPYVEDDPIRSVSVRYHRSREADASFTGCFNKFWRACRLSR